MCDLLDLVVNRPLPLWLYLTLIAGMIALGVLAFVALFTTANAICSLL